MPYLAATWVTGTWVTRSSLPYNAERSCSENLLHFEPISLRTICLVSAVISALVISALVISGFAAAALDVVFALVSTSKARIKYPLNDYHSNDRSYIRSKRENTSDGS